MKSMNSNKKVMIPGKEILQSVFNQIPSVKKFSYAKNPIIVTIDYSEAEANNNKFVYAQVHEIKIIKIHKNGIAGLAYVYYAGHNADNYGPAIVLFPIRKRVRTLTKKNITIPILFFHIPIFTIEGETKHIGEHFIRRIEHEDQFCGKISSHEKLKNTKKVIPRKIWYYEKNIILELKKHILSRRKNETINTCHSLNFF